MTSHKSFMTYYQVYDVIMRFDCDVIRFLDDSPGLPRDYSCFKPEVYLNVRLIPVCSCRYSYTNMSLQCGFYVLYVIAPTNKGLT